MNTNIITVKTALSTGLFLSGVVFITPASGAEIDNYTSSLQTPWNVPPHSEDTIVQPAVSFDCNAETVISMRTKKDAEILNNFAGTLLKGMKSLDADISRWVDENFWDLV